MKIAQRRSPVPNVAAVVWKRTHLDDEYIGLTGQRIEQVIADEVAFLETHPTGGVAKNV